MGPRRATGRRRGLLWAAVLLTLTLLAPSTPAVLAQAAAPAVATVAPTPATTPGPSAGSTATDGAAPLPIPAAEGAIPGPPQVAPEVTARGAVLVDPSDGIILTGVDERIALPMASTTKIMTVLLALEQVEQGIVAPELTVSAFAAEVGRTPGGATLGLREGEVVSVRDVLAGLLLRSGNDGAVAIAEHIAGSEPAFVAMMNQRAIEMGLENTSFVNASGLTDDLAHHATSLDLARLGVEAMAHEDFARWAGATVLDVDGLGRLENRNEMLTAYDGTTGIKTGFTTLAGLCLVASAERDGRTLYAVVLGSDDRVADASALFNHGFNDYSRPVPLQVGDTPATYRWTGQQVTLQVAEELGRTIGVGAEVAVVTRLAPDAGPPIESGTPLGEAVLVVDGVEVDRTALVASDAVGEPAADATAAVADAIRAFSRLREHRMAVQTPSG